MSRTGFNAFDMIADVDVCLSPKTAVAGIPNVASARRRPLESDRIRVGEVRQPGWGLNVTGFRGGSVIRPRRIPDGAETSWFGMDHPIIWSSRIRRRDLGEFQRPNLQDAAAR